MKCCTLPSKEGKVKKERKTHNGRGKMAGKAAKACKGKKMTAFRRCVKAKIRGMKKK